MIEENTTSHESVELSGWQKHKFLVMVGGAVAIAMVLIAVSMHLYASSGAAQLDLSLPIYEKDRKQISTESASNFPATGIIDKNTMLDYQKQLDKQIKQTSSAEGFNSAGLSDDALGLSGSNATATGE